MTGSTIRQALIFKASRHEVYEALMDSKKHSKFTGSPAKISRKVGGKFSIFDGWVIGKNLKLVKDKKIIQSWRGTDKEWPKGHDSKVSFELIQTSIGTKLNFTHSNIPEGWKSSLAKGWRQYYWKPMKKMFEKSRAKK